MEPLPPRFAPDNSPEAKERRIMAYGHAVAFVGIEVIGNLIQVDFRPAPPEPKAA